MRGGKAAADPQSGSAGTATRRRAFRFGFPIISLFAFPWRVLGCGARQRAALVYAKHTPWCQTVKISEFIIVLPVIFLDRISSI